jgi:hypothetical protein
LVSCGYYIVCLSSIYGFWLPFGIFCHYIVCLSSDWPFGILWLLYCLSFFHLRLLVALLVSFAIILSVFLRFLWLPFWYLRFTASDCRFGILDLRLLIALLVIILSLYHGHYVVCLSSDWPFGIL